MKIKKIEMTNVKCYSNAEFDFENGINFISGMNGAGKTSIIESIGYALFDYKVGKKSGFSTYFIRRGEKKAEVKITFEDKEKNEYIVERKISINANNSWIIKDIEKEEEIVSGEIDVINWLKDHLGFYRDDNISDIYENIIGVPQGMYTSAFLDTLQGRKNKFDPIFNLEIYRTVFKNTAGLESGIRAKKANEEAEIGKIKVKIEMLTSSKNEYSELKKEISAKKLVQKNKEKEYKRIDKLYEEKSKIKNEIIKIEEIIKIDKLKNDNAEKNVKDFNKNLQIANKAKQILGENKIGYDTYIEEEKKQKELKNTQKNFNKLNEEKTKLKNNIDNCNEIIKIKNETKQEKENKIEKLKKEMQEKEEEIKQENENINNKLLKLEEEKINLTQIQEKENKLEKAKIEIEKNEVIIKNYIKNIENLDKIKQKETEIIENKKELENKIKNKQKIEESKKEIEEKINKLSAKQEQLKESKKIAKEGVCPYLKSECINVKGKTQEEYENEITKINAEISLIKQEKIKIEKRQKEIIKSETELKNLELKIQEIEENKKEIKKEQNEKEKIEIKNKEIKKEIEEILKKNNLKNIIEFKEFSQKKQREFNEQDKIYNINKTNLENNKKELEKQKKELEKENNEIEKIEEQIRVQNENIQKYNEKIKIINQELEKYTNIEEKIEENEKKMLETKSAYDLYMQNKEVAKTVEELKKKIEKVLSEIKKIEENLEKNNEKLENLKKDYKEEELIEIENKRNNLSITLAENMAKIEAGEERIQVLKIHVEQLSEIQKTLKEITKKVKVYEKAIEYLAKIRQIIKQAPEDIAEILIQKVSRKATEIYSMIAGDNTRLEWREGYEVILIDNIAGRKIEKEFRQLSGGEQMSAALAIRISMLEILTSLKIGILDEPTVNMDVGRRQRLAEIIENIGGLFIQLFIVSHDDTFNSVTENTIKL